MSNPFSISDFRNGGPSLQGQAFIAALFKLGADEFNGVESSEGRDFVRAAVAVSRGLGDESYRAFVTQAVRAMTELRGRAESDAGLAEILYRAFDSMDDVFDLRYALDLGMKSDPLEPERLYEGAGVGVQTSYSSILCALSHLRLSNGAHLIDLGSGYGRVGMMAGLWREDLRFTGYEYVGHRVDICTASTGRAGLDGRVKFLRQDLADPAFEIPEADAYYLYDPFCESTYRRVLARLGELGHSRPISVVTKANAGNWFPRLVNGDEWGEPEVLDAGTLKIFRSRRPR